MPLSLVDPVLAKQRFFNQMALSPAVYELSVALFKWLMQQGARPDLQVVEFDHLTNTDTVIADAACKIRAIVLRKTTATTAWFKATDHNTTGATNGSQTISHRLDAIGVSLLAYPAGLAMATGFTLRSNTTATGATDSGAGDGAAGVVLLSAA